MGSLRLNFIICILAFTIAIFVHLNFGAKSIKFIDIFNAFWDYDSDNFDQVIIRNMRFPRLITAICVGAALSVSGALMQGATRNPLADPGLLALMSGASFGVIVGSNLFSINSFAWLPLFASGGAILTSVLVLIIATAAPSRSVVGLLLAGAAVSALCKAIVIVINLLNEESFATFRVWLSGAITNNAANTLPWCLPWIILGLLVAVSSAKGLTALSLGYETAKGLGVNVKWLGNKIFFSVIVLTASAVALVGPLGFVGLVVPHITRLIFGQDYEKIIPFSALIGAIFMLLVDLLSRIILAPTELATGIITSLIGGPIFIILVRRLL